MKSDQRDELRAVLTVGSRTYVENLASAERAVLAGQFNVAKLMRALAYSHRVAATNAARILSPSGGVEAMMAANALALAAGTGGDTGPDGSTDARMHLERIARVRSRSRELVARATESLQNNGEIFDDDLGEILWSCAGCGYLAEDERPEVCPICGALAAEFEDFGPFYIDTPEHLGHRSPEEILTILSATPDRIAHLLRDVDSRILAAKPSTREWCLLEIVGHLSDIEDLFLTLVRPILESDDVPSLSIPVPAWKLHIGKGYETARIGELIERFARIRRQTTRLVGGLEAGLWSRLGRMPWKNVSVLDLGTWVANHDLGHLAQMERRIQVARGE